MNVLRASKAGFCMGVSLALQKLDEALANVNKFTAHNRICTLGPIIHNPQVLGAYAKRGVACLNSCSEIEAGDHVLIRAHGITREEEAIAWQKGSKIVDATCPRVKNAQTAIYNATIKKEPLLLFGEPQHPEVRGLLSYACGKAIVFQSLGELLNYPLKKSETYILASQTTQDRQNFETISEKLATLLPHLVILNTICDATRLRQREVMEIAQQVECMVIVGGKASGNTRRLAALAREIDIAVFHIETEEELNKNDFRNFKNAGLAAGASTPTWLIDKIENLLKSIE